jgi:uncharacterized membrane protein HdeD (DUF308 family)
MILNAILGVLDILGGILLVISGFVPYGSSGFILTVGGVFITKGVLIFIYSKFGKESHYDWGSVLDLLTGIILVMLFFGTYLFVFPVIGLIMIVKGVITFAKSLVS